MINEKFYMLQGPKKRESNICFYFSIRFQTSCFQIGKGRIFKDMTFKKTSLVF